MNFKKRKTIAVSIDCFIVACFLTLLNTLLNIDNKVVFMLFYSVLAYLIFLVLPLMFRNASIGMVIMSLRIVDKDYRIPKMSVILKRGILIPLLGFEIFKSYFNGNDDFFHWELKHLGTVIVPKESQKH